MFLLFVVHGLVMFGGCWWSLVWLLMVVLLLVVCLLFVCCSFVYLLSYVEFQYVTVCLFFVCGQACLVLYIPKL